MNQAQKKNADIWDGLYAKGLVIAYPNDVFVRVTHRLFKPETHKKLLDYGFGTGQNAVHLLKRGFDVHGVEVSATAVKNAEALFAKEGFPAKLKLLENQTLPYPDASFDGVVAWGVLEYNDWDGFKAAVKEIDRVLAPGGVFLGAINAPGDAKHKHGKALGGGLYELSADTGQGGAKVLIVEKEQLAECFPGRALTVGHYEHSFDVTYARHWIVSYRK